MIGAQRRAHRLFWAFLAPVLAVVSVLLLLAGGRPPEGPNPTVGPGQSGGVP